MRRTGFGIRDWGFGVVLAALVAAARPAAAQQVHLLIVTGVEADAEDGAAMHELAGGLIDAAKGQAGGPGGASVTWLADKPADDGARIAGRATRDVVQRTVADIAAHAGAEDQVVIVLIGHGSFDGTRAAFNLPGPDLTAPEWAALVARFGRTPVTFVNTASSSGAFLEPMKAPGRTVITATRTGGERNDPRFAPFFVEAFAGEAADRNRDGRVSVAEAFEYAKTKVQQAYQQEGIVLTEHATIEDSSGAAMASAVFLAPSRGDAALAAAAAADPELQALVAARRTLEGQVNALRARKGTMDPAEYDRRLEALLTDLAVKTRQIQQRQADKP